MKYLKVLAFLMVIAPWAYGQSNIKLTENFDSPGAKYEKIGRGLCEISNSVLTTRDAYLGFGETSWADYEVKFSARVPDTASQVQICAGFRAANRDDRYFVMLKGGIQKDIYLARQGYMGTDDFLALRELDFQPLPGKWYQFKIQVAGSRIRVFLNDEKLPRIDVIDKLTALAPAGKVTLGGSWITNEFDNLSITGLDAHALKGITQKEYAPPAINKETLRKAQRATYRPLVIGNVTNVRQEISMDGEWLFAPGYEVDDSQAADPTEDDKSWHVMKVPEFWTPSRVWLHGEKYNGDSKGVADNYYQKETDRCQAYTFDYKKTATAWYRHWMLLPDNIKGKNLQLSFDAVSKIAEVWVNGKKAGEHTGMFGDFKVDISSLVKPGKNLIAVKVTKDYIKDIKDADKIAGVAVTVEVTEKMVKDLAHGFFAEDPAGIWQPVSLIITNPLRIEDVFIRPNLSGADIDVTIKNDNSTDLSFNITTGIKDAKTNASLYQNTSADALMIKAGEQKTFTYNVKNLKPDLWTPEHPNLYNFSFGLEDKAHHELDIKVIRSGFRTFQAIGDYLYLNGKKYWLRGGNQTAMPLGPNDTALADKFCKLMKAGNIMVTRTHTVPYTETWLNASDENGIGVSFEGTWPWLFLGSSMPDIKLVNLWKNEFLDLLKKYRNHPSLLMWTVNNEMKFYDNDPDFNRVKIKMKVISDVVKQMRVIDPTRPVVFDSNYKRNTKKFGADYFKDIDDGDIDDVHAYYNWYDYSIFDFFNGEWQKKNKNPGRPLISQEMSTGYTDETGHATRFYNYVHQNPSALAGKYTYEYDDPEYFLKPQAFITKELAEALRRSDGQSAGVLHFSAVTWFSNAWSAGSIKPFPVYYDVKRALQPVLVSAELWGRHFYAGTTIPTRICIVNDQENGEELSASVLQWKLVTGDGKMIAEGKQDIAAVPHYGRLWVTPAIAIPADLPNPKVEGRLELSLTHGENTISENQYDLEFATKQNADAARLAGKNIAVVDLNNTTKPALDLLGVQYSSYERAATALKQKADIYIFSGLDSVNTSAEDIKQIRAMVSQGGKILISQSGRFGHNLYPEYIRSLIKENGEVAMMDIPESAVFDGVAPLETRNFNNNKRELPSVVSGAFRINRSPNVDALASYTRVHGYLSGSVDEKMARLDQVRGFPIIAINENGTAMLSEIRTDKAVTDPVAARLLVNMLNALLKNRTPNN